MSFPRYPTYKDSGVEWLGDVPAHWRVIRLKQACTVFPSNVDKHSRDDEPPVLLCNYTDVYYNERITHDMTFMSATAAPEQISKFTLKSGDTIITKDSETADDIAIAAYVPKYLPGVVCGYHLSMIRPKASTCGAFIKRLFDSLCIKSQVAVAANGLTRVGLGQYAIDNLDVPLPPEDEQIVIATFLDRETAKIDALVAEQENLIGLLKEKRSAVISHAVTKGLNPSAPMKDSGVEWLGEVPAHWVSMSIKFALKGIVDTEHKTAPFFDDGEYLVVRTSNVRDGKLVLDDAKFTNREGFDEWTRRAVPCPGDIIFTREAPAGQACIVPAGMNLCLGQRTVLMQVDHSRLLASFALWSIYGGVAAEFIDLLSQGSTVAHFNMSDIGQIPLLLPPMTEQQAIVDHLHRCTGELDALIAEAQSATKLLQERRTALISAAVTGQIDVRQQVS